MNQIENDLKVNANPTKEFFISMLTRDIDIKAAILELIDNSIDGAKRIRKDNNFEGLKIDIKFDENQFIIEDNCGGMSIDIAQNYAFRFGRAKERPTDGGSLTGIFGIGMKRALFRLGNQFSVSSITQKEKFILEVDVPTWLQDDNQDWAFKFKEAQKNMNNSANEIGTKIVVSSLHDGIKDSFKMQYFANVLKDYIARYRTIAAENGMTISINSIPVLFTQETIIKSNIVQPYVRKHNVDGIDIIVIAGVAPKGRPEDAGWYVYCNGRIIVYADKSDLTGWGKDGLRQYHPQLAYFRGYVFFESKKLDLLPWNTTKTSVDTSSKIYIFARSLMNESTKQVIEATKKLEDPEEIEFANQILDANKIVKLNTASISDLTVSDSSFKIFIQSMRTEIPMTTISFKEKPELVARVKKSIRAKSNREVGEKLFDYYVERELEDE